MTTKKDYSHIVGEKYGRWTISRTYKKGSHHVADCMCSCGNMKEAVRISTLRHGESRSCGCLQKEEASSRSTIHGNCKHPLYQAYYDMVRRCTNPLRKDYHHYGGRRIKVCDRWLEPSGGGFKNFLEDSKNFEGEGNEIDRRDVDGNYCPENCKWATRKEQTRNTRFNHVIEYKGDSKCMAEWAEDLGIPYSILQDRLGKLKWPVEKVFTHPLKPRKMVLYREDSEFEVKDVFKTPPNQFARAKGLGLTFYQFFATLFKHEFEVKAYLGKEWCEIKPLVQELGEFKLNLTPEFEQYCRDNGLTMGGRIL